MGISYFIKLIASAEVLDGGLIRISFRVRFGEFAAFSRYRFAVLTTYLCGLDYYLLH